ncbi:hypothetical protein ACIQJW_08160 [Streptomyces californicus]|uniref:hypothetical protein n=1 Tax=Streptomyces californicus TaxID=67351 RepID=UPI0037F99823
MTTQPERIALDDLTSDALDDLYARLDRAAGLADRLEEFAENALRADDRKLYAAIAADLNVIDAAHRPPGDRRRGGRGHRQRHRGDLTSAAGRGRSPSRMQKVAMKSATRTESDREHDLAIARRVQANTQG